MITTLTFADIGVSVEPGGPRFGGSFEGEFNVAPDGAILGITLVEVHHGREVRRLLGSSTWLYKRLREAIEDECRHRIDAVIADADDGIIDHDAEHRLGLRELGIGGR